jgi:hypothetical protein
MKYGAYEIKIPTDGYKNTMPFLLVGRLSTHEAKCHLCSLILLTIQKLKSCLLSGSFLRSVCIKGTNCSM